MIDEKTTPNGRIVSDIGENRKRKFKSKLYSIGVTMTDWLKDNIDNFINADDSE